MCAGPLSWLSYPLTLNAGCLVTQIMPGERGALRAIKTYMGWFDTPHPLSVEKLEPKVI